MAYWEFYGCFRNPSGSFAIICKYLDHQTVRLTKRKTQKHHIYVCAMQKNTFLFGSLGFDGDFESLTCLLGCFGPLQILFGVRASWLLFKEQQAQTAKRPEKDKTRTWKSASCIWTEKGEREREANRMKYECQSFFIKKNMNTNIHTFIRPRHVQPNQERP